MDLWERCCSNSTTQNLSARCLITKKSIADIANIAIMNGGVNQQKRRR